MEKILNYIRLFFIAIYKIVKFFVSFCFYVVKFMLIVCGPFFIYFFFKSPSVNRVVLRGKIYELTDTTRKCDDGGKLRYTVRSDSSNYEPSRNDSCVNCGRPYWRHWIYRTEEQKKEAENALENMLTYPS